MHDLFRGSGPAKCNVLEPFNVACHYDVEAGMVVTKWSLISSKVKAVMAYSS